MNYKAIKHLELVAICTEKDIIGHMEKRKAKRADYRKVWRLIKTLCAELMDEFMLNDVSFCKYIDYYNPYAKTCLITKHQIMVVHSGIEYLFNYKSHK